MAVACGHCRDPIPVTGTYESHLVVSKSRDGHLHTHGDLERKTAIHELIQEAADQSGMALLRKPAETLPAEIVFKNRQRIGDMLMFTCGVRDFHAAYPSVRLNVISTCGHLWDHNPAIDRTLVPTPENTIPVGPSELTNASNRLDWHFANAFRVSMEKTLRVPIPQGESRPDLWLTQEEYDAPRPFPMPYWIIVTGGEKGWGCKMYPTERWQEVIRQNPDVTFVQVGAAKDQHEKLQGPNVIDHLGKTEDRHTGIRDLLKLFLNAEGSIGLVSFHMHLSGALYKPAVIVAGAREPVSFTRYAGHQYLSNDGCLPCADVKACWHCDINACTNLVQLASGPAPRCADMIEPEDVTQALRRYYKGGRLVLGQPSAKTPVRKGSRPGVNVVPTPKTTAIPVTAPLPKDEFEALQARFGMTFGGGSITDQDYVFLRNTIQAQGVKTILEFGAGLSTLLLSELAEVWSFETSQGWVDKVIDTAKAVGIRGPRWLMRWDGLQLETIKPTVTPLPAFDLAFVDGPSGGASREHSTKIASERARVVVVHDAGRPHERTWQETYLKGRFDGPYKGGHRCHLWIRKAVAPGPVSTRPQVEPPAAGVLPGPAAGPIGRASAPSRSQDDQEGESTPCTVATDQGASGGPGKGRFVKIVSTARGWGGCARSVTTIMKLLLAAGHRVEFIPFRHQVGSKEFQAALANGLAAVQVTTSFDTLAEPCDALLVYSDDFVWEFRQPQLAAAFHSLRARRRILMLNYRRGEVGQIPWTQGWDRYLFLNSTQERELLKVLPGVSTGVLPPCTDLEPFFQLPEPDYGNGLRIVRHSSQGDTKFPKDCGERIHQVLASRPGIRIEMLPGPSFVPQLHDHDTGSSFSKHPRTGDPATIAQFLTSGNLFWYDLPLGYMDMGPRVILEAMAAGLPILADPWGGAVDRVTEACGWLLPKAEQVALLGRVTPEDLAAKGRAARARAHAEFDPSRWLTELVPA